MKNHHIFEDARGYVVIVPESDTLNKEITEHRELEKKSFVKYFGVTEKQAKRPLDYNVENMFLYPSVERSLHSDLVKYYKLDITATEIPQEEIEKAKNEAN